MPASPALSSTVSRKAVTIPQGMAGAIIQNSSASDIFININAEATADDIVLPGNTDGAPSEVALSFPVHVQRDIVVHAIAASGTPVLNYILMPSGAA